ncbi:MAG: AEC family transporter [Oscillospiraceae bacterium]|nr:AEC family transporter [Oscillospiraceae bacterium]
MNNLLFSINAVFPLFLLTALGWFLTNRKVWNGDFLKLGNTLSFNIFIPAMLFVNIYTADFKEVFDGKLLGFVLMFVCAVCIIGFVLTSLLVKSRARRGVILQALFRGNFALLGVPLCQALAGDEGAQIASVFLAFLIPVFNIFATILLSIYSNDPIESPVAVIKKILKNPLIIACLAGFVFSFARIPLPKLILKPIGDLKSLATPFALLILGGDFKFKSFVKNLRYILSAGLSRLILIPSLAVLFAALLGFRGLHIALVISTFATPVAVSSTAMTYKMNGDYDLACELVVFTTVASAVSITLLTFVSKLSGIL